MGPHKVRLMMKAEREMAARRFRRQRNKNYLARPGIHECVVVLDHLKPSYNIGKIFRSAEAFGAREIHLVGIDFFDPAPGMGAFKWVPAVFHKTFLSAEKRLYVIDDFHYQLPYNLPRYPNRAPYHSRDEKV